MGTARVGVGEAIAGVSALALFVFMFLPWYGVEEVDGVGVGTFGGAASAWEAFTLVDILLFLICVLVVGLVLIATTGATVDLPRSAGEVIAAAGGIAFLLILLRMIFAPDLDTGGFDLDVEVGRRIGLLLALIAAAGIAYGGWRATERDPAAGA